MATRAGALEYTVELEKAFVEKRIVPMLQEAVKKSNRWSIPP